MTCEHSFIGGLCEACKQERFVSLVGGVRRADALFYIYTQSYPSGSVSRADVFRRTAVNRGFTRAEADALLAL